MVNGEPQIVRHGVHQAARMRDMALSN